MKLPAAVKDALSTVADDVLADARARAPHRSGRLAGSITKRSAGATSWGVGYSRVPYFSAIHFGTGAHPAGTGWPGGHGTKRGPHAIKSNPFLLNAEKAAAGKAAAATQRAIDKLVADLP